MLKVPFYFLFKVIQAIHLHFEVWDMGGGGDRLRYINGALWRMVMVYFFSSHLGMK